MWSRSRVGRTATRYRGIASKLLALSAQEWRDLIAAQWALLRAQYILRSRPEGKLVEVELDQPSDESRDLSRQADAQRLARAISRAANFGVIRPACLVRSMALCRLLESRGIDGSRVEVGVAMRDGRFVAHAWVRWRGQILGDEESRIQEYRPMSGVGVVLQD